ncbi:MAG: quinohemoprotein amine dehydrogenase maturation protein [Acidobacteriia bacterium]|nr:quinohemoprotein amine dehydrogenase maturation protein [Terriglobia bacterium]
MSHAHGLPHNFLPLSHLLPAGAAGIFSPAMEAVVEAPLCVPPDEPAVLLSDIREFAAGGSSYVFVVDVTAVFALDGLSRDILHYLRPGKSAPAPATEGRQAAGAGYVLLKDIFCAFEGTHDRQQIGEALRELRSIRAIRFSGFPGEEWKTPQRQLPPAPFPQRSLVLNVANDCNLGCSYCFAAQGDYGTPKRMMQEETARSSVDFLLANSADQKNVTLVFFGGEPLMNLGLIRRVVAYAGEASAKAGKHVDFTMTTNATGLTTEVIDFLSENRIGVSVSIDGPKEYNDLRRTYKNGMGSYDHVRPRILELLHRHKTRPVAARATLTHGITAVEECFWHLLDMGFHEVGFAPVTSSAQEDFALTSEELWTVLEAFRKLSDIYVERALKNESFGFSNLSNLLGELHTGISKNYPCGAGLGLLGVGADGDLYLCHRFSESPAHRMGSVQEGLDVARQTDFLSRAHLSNKPHCGTCWVRHVCAGGCYHEANTHYGSLYHANAHYCEWIRSWIDLGLHAYARIMESNPDFFPQFIEKRGAV